MKHFNYTYLRKAFQTALLNELEKQIGPSFKKVKAAIYKKDKNGFYVYAKPTLTDPSTVSQYISRYLGRPVIGLSRIDSYDGESVTFHYNRHEDNVYVEKTLPAIDFREGVAQLVHALTGQVDLGTQLVAGSVDARANRAHLVGDAPGCAPCMPGPYGIIGPI